MKGSKLPPESWQHLYDIGDQSWVCGYCADKVASRRGYYCKGYRARILICAGCGQPTYFVGDVVVPGDVPAAPVRNLPASVEAFYEEIRQCAGVSAHTACVLACRKMLMHIAVQEGDKPGRSFLDYVNYLADKGFLPPRGKVWVDHIRSKGNEANHEIVVMKREDATLLLTFIEMLLRFLYEFPGMLPTNP